MMRLQGRALVGGNHDGNRNVGVGARRVLEKEGAVVIKSCCQWGQGGVGAEEDVDALHGNGVSTGNMGDQEMTSVEGGVQVLNASVDGAPPQTEVHAPITAVHVAKMKQRNGGDLRGRDVLSTGTS